jgi:hypothetical protein
MMREVVVLSALFREPAAEVAAVAYGPRFGRDSRARTPRLVGTGYSRETGTRPTGFSYVNNNQLAIQVE